MPRMSKADRLKRYNLEVRWAVRWRETEGFDDLWHSLIDMYKGKHFPEAQASEDRIAINIAFSTINVIYPSVSVNYPKINIQAVDPNHDDQSVYAEVALNYYWRHYDFQQPMRLAVKDFLILGHGWGKVGWNYEEQDELLGEDEYQEAVQTQIDQANMFAAQNPELAAGLPSDEEIAANVVTTKSVIVEDRPYLDRVDPFHMYVNPDATSMQDIRWIAQRVIRTLEDAKADDRYSPAARRRLKASAGWDGSWMQPEDRRKYDDVLDRVVLWEFYDLASGTMCIFEDGNNEDYLVDPFEVPFFFGQPHPFVMLRNYDVPGQFYPIGDLEMLQPMNDELNKTRSMMMNHRKRYNRKWLYRERAFDADGKRLLASDVDGVVVPVIDEQTPLNDLIVQVPTDQITGDLYNYSEIIKSDLHEVSGISEYARGDTAEIRRTATEAAMIQDATNARSAEKLTIVERFITDIARKMMTLMQQFTTQQQIARMNGRNGEVIWLEFSREDIEGEFDFIVEAGSTQPQSDTVKRQQAVAMAQVLMPFAQLGVINPQALAHHLLKQFGVKNPEQFMGGMMPMGAPGVPAPGGEPGMNGAQPSPADLSQAKGDAAAGVNPAILSQLAGQVGLNMGG